MQTSTRVSSRGESELAPGPVSNANDAENAVQEYLMTVEIARQPSNLYSTPMPNLKR